MTDFSGYLRSLSTAYEKWWEYYTLTDAEGRAEIRPETFDFGWVETVRSAERGEQAESREKVERLPVLAGLRKYAAGHVLLVGRPGSGKSTALARLLLEEAALTLNPSPLGRGTLNSAPLLPGEKGLGDEGPIPVLVELRYWQGSIVDLIRAFFGRHGVQVDRAQVEQWLFDRRLLLCVDGLNELPSEAGRQDVARLRRDFPQVAMIFTTRDLSLGGDFGIEQKLEMQALTEPQMREFVRSYLPDQGETMLRQLGDRLREFGQTPLLLWMLCGLFRQSGQIPANLGGVFRAFTQGYERKVKGDVLPEGDRRWWAGLLQALAAAMMWGAEGAAVEFRVAISKTEVCAIFAWFLWHKEDQPGGAARKCLEDLLKHHLILASGEQVEFRHQLIQEYYAAEWLLERVGRLGDGKLKWGFLNFLKWTEPVALMLALVEEEALAVRVVRLGLEVDLMLGARLAGEVKPQFQAQTVGLVEALEVPDWLKIKLLGKTRSEAAIPGLLKLTEDAVPSVRTEDAVPSVRESVVETLGNIGSVEMIPPLLKLMEDVDSSVRDKAAAALGNIGSVEAIPGLLKLVGNASSFVRGNAVEVLGSIGSVEVIPDLLKLVEDVDSPVRQRTATVLGNIGSVEAIPGLLKLVEDVDSSVRQKTAAALDSIGSVEVIPPLLKLMKDANSSVRQRAAAALNRIGSVEAIPGLLKLMENADSSVRQSAAAALNRIGSVELNRIGSVEAIPGLLKLLEHADSDMRERAAGVLGSIGTADAIPGLLKLVEDANSSVRQRTASALGSIGTADAIPPLLKLMKDANSSVRQRTASALGRIGTADAIPPLLKLMKDADHSVFRIAAEALGNIGSVEAIPGLLKLLEHADSDMRERTVEVLGSIGSIEAIPGLLKLMEDADRFVLRSVAEALGNIGSAEAIPSLLQLLEYPDRFVPRSAAEALGKIGSAKAIPSLLKLLMERANFLVCVSAAEALGKIGSAEAIPGLLKLLEEYPNSSVSRMAVNTLGKIGVSAPNKVAPHLPYLLTLIPTQLGKSTHRAILSIQTNCKFYNYEIWQAYLADQ